MLIYVLVVVSYGILGLVFGFIAKKSPLAWGLILSSPIIVGLMLYAFGEPEALIQILINIFLTLTTA